MVKVRLINTAEDGIMKMLYLEDYNNHSVKELRLEARSMGVLIQNQIATIKDLIDNMDRITGTNGKRKYRNCGVATQKDIQSGLVQFYLSNMKEKQQTTYLTALQLLNNGALAYEPVVEEEAVA